MVEIADREELLHVCREQGLFEMFGCFEKLSLRFYAFHAGEFLCMAGKELQSLYLVTRGRVRIFSLTQNGGQFLLSFAEPPCFLGAVEFIQGGPSPEYVQAVTDGACLAVPLAENKALLQGDLAFHKYMCKSLCGQLSEANRKALDRRALPLEPRLAAYLEFQYGKGQDLSALGELSERMGCSYRHLQRALSSLCEKGILERGTGARRGRYRIKDFEGLKHLQVI